MTVSELIHRERTAVLGWGRAILLQFAHPLVAAGVSDHSGFSGSRLARVRRLHATVGAMLDVTFGDQARAQATADRINAIHRRVNGRLRGTAGPFPAGTPYSATDPELLLWVHATLLDSVPLAYEHFVGPLPAGHPRPARDQAPTASLTPRDRYCLESTPAARRLGIPEDMLIKTEAGLAAYMRGMLEGPAITVTPNARELARQLLYPPLTDPTRPSAWLVRLVTLGLLPPAIREAYRFRWTPSHERALGALSATLRRLLPLTPPLLRHWPRKSAHRRHHQRPHL
ncbi:MAG TPA: oxygenase MpaB family protein [Vicinamibacterales bacterium]|nr:oxygenase MpaB family protein [Vicinamibacterales bacterium]